jgi:hypothetical protein
MTASDPPTVDWLIPATSASGEDGAREENDSTRLSCPDSGSEDVDGRQRPHRAIAEESTHTDAHVVSRSTRRQPILIDLPDDNNDGIVRVRVKRDGIRTSVSLDVMFYVAGSLLIGGDKKFESWLQDQVTALDVSWANRAMSSKLGDRVRPNAGLSRLIQRRILQMVIEKASTK